MRLTIEPTCQFFMAGDVMVRLWKGHTETGATVLALVTAVATAAEQDDFTGQLTPIPPPTEADARRWAESILRGPP
jgi:hypothetical protein